MGEQPFVVPTVHRIAGCAAGHSRPSRYWETLRRAVQPWTAPGRRSAGRDRRRTWCDNGHLDHPTPRHHVIINDIMIEPQLATVVTINRPDVVALIQFAADRLTAGNKTEAVAHRAGLPLRYLRRTDHSLCRTARRPLRIRGDCLRERTHHCLLSNPVVLRAPLINRQAIQAPVPIPPSEPYPQPPLPPNALRRKLP
jgi:hypothetical protein